MKEITREDVVKYIEKNDLRGDMLMLAEMMGVEFAKQLMLAVGGLTLHVQSIDSANGAFKRLLRERFDCSDMSKSNIVYISKRTNRTCKTIRRVLREINDETIT